MRCRWMREMILCKKLKPTLKPTLTLPRGGNGGCWMMKTEEKLKDV